MKAPQKSLKDWGDQKWRTKSGKPSSKTGERYLPEKAIKSLTPSEYAATTRAKRAGKAAGKQFVAQPKTIAKKKARRDNTDFTQYAEGGKVNAAGNYTKPGLRKRIVAQVKAAATHGTGAGQWSARKAQLVAKKYKEAGGGYRD